MILRLDTERPLSEPRWVKTGDVYEWLKTMFGRMFWVAGDAAEEGWEKKIEVKDPDPVSSSSSSLLPILSDCLKAPTIKTILDGWATNSTVGQQSERHRFLRTHMSEPDNVLEILLRLVRSERATFQTQPALSASTVAGPLLAALTRSPVHGAQQTHVSLAVLAIYRMAAEYATKVIGEKGQAEVEERVGEIIRCLPSSLIYKSLDGMFKEWRQDKKGSR
jgi:20S proteasome subunit alpha 6